MKKLGHDPKAIAAAEQQAHGSVVIIIIAKREGDARGRAPAPVLVLWLWNGIKMTISGSSRVERVRRNERGAAIGGRRNERAPRSADGASSSSSSRNATMIIVM
jgi:hypothetical protein